MNPASIVQQEFLRELGRSLSEFLERELPRITGAGWWERSVLSMLTSMQLDSIKRRNITALTGLDLSALLRVLDQNWHDISRSNNFPWEVRNFIKETHSIRNRWAHAGTHPAPEEDTYRDLDTMQRLAQALGDSSLAERLGRAKRDLLHGGSSTKTLANLPSVLSWDIGNSLFRGHG